MNEVQARVVSIVAEHLKVEEAKITPESNFVEDLGADSLDQVELMMAFEEAFGCEIPDEAASKIHTIADAVKFIQERAA